MTSDRSNAGDAGQESRRLDPSVAAELREVAKRLEFQGDLLSREELEDLYARFAERFGPAKLAALRGEALLETMFNGSSPKSLAYWLERGERNEDGRLEVTCGLIGGGPPLTRFGIYRRSKKNVWVARTSDSKSREVSLNEAIDIATFYRDQLLAAWQVMAAFEATTDDRAYARLQADLERAAPQLYDRAWVHKYFHMLRSDALDDYHIEGLQVAHLLTLLEVPPPGTGRYLRAGRYVRIAQELGWSLNQLSRVLNHRPWVSAEGHRLVPVAAMERRGDQARLSYGSQLKAGTVFAVCEGQEVVAIGCLQDTHDPKEAPGGMPAWTRVQWLDEGRWRLPKPERGGHAVKLLKDMTNRVEVERRIRAAGRRRAS